MIHFQKKPHSELDALIAKARKEREKIWELAFKTDPQSWEERKKIDKTIMSLAGKISEYIRTHNLKINLPRI